MLDPETAADRATFEEPKRHLSGFEYVIVNGHVVVERGRHTGARPNRVIRGRGFGGLALAGAPDGVRIVNDSAEHLADHLRAAGRPAADAIVWSLPWANFSRDLQERLLRAVVRALRPGGRFATFAYVPAAYLPPGRRFRSLLESSLRGSRRRASCCGTSRPPLSTAARSRSVPST